MAFRYDAPEVSGFTIPGAVATIGLRDWILPTAPFRGTESVLPTKKLGFVVHHPGVDQFRYIWDAREAAREIQRQYLATRKYSIGYNWVVDLAGRIAVARGWYRSAANGTDLGNGGYNAILVLIDKDDAVTEAARLAVQQIVHYGRTVHGYEDEIVGHQEIKATACPGPLMPLVRAGAFEPQLPPPVIDPPVVELPPRPPEGVAVEGYEVIQFVYEGKPSATFVKHGLTIAWIYNVPGFDIVGDWQRAIGQAGVKLYPSTIARQLKLQGRVPDDQPDLLPFAALGVNLI